MSVYVWEGYVVVLLVWDALVFDSEDVGTIEVLGENESKECEVIRAVRCFIGFTSCEEFEVHVC